MPRRRADAAGPAPPTRRSLLQALAALVAAAPVDGQPARALTGDDVRRLSLLLGRDVPGDRADAVGRGLADTLRRLERLRALDLDDALEPAVVFDPRPAGISAAPREPPRPARRGRGAPRSARRP